MPNLITSMPVRVRGELSVQPWMVAKGAKKSRSLPAPRTAEATMPQDSPARRLSPVFLAFSIDIRRQSATSHRAGYQSDRGRQGASQQRAENATDPPAQWLQAQGIADQISNPAAHPAHRRAEKHRDEYQRGPQGAVLLAHHFGRQARVGLDRHHVKKDEANQAAGAAGHNDRQDGRRRRRVWAGRSAPSIFLRRWARGSEGRRWRGRERREWADMLHQFGGGHRFLRRSGCSRSAAGRRACGRGSRR